MTQAERIKYQVPEEYASGMVIEEVSGDATPSPAGWPFKASRFEVPPGSTTELDVHDVVELWMVRAGRGTVASGTDVFDVGAGEMVFFPSRVSHQITNTGTDVLRLFSVWWKGSPA
ncbi:MAG TPA: cupin domain-containing protein [Streptosporangiaceae bacterium]|jgi:mannose-6-phosphate isomerase-like protein (cupin superfamily)